jgi:hypothetical protein
VSAAKTVSAGDDCGFNFAGVVDFLIETRSLPALARRYHRDFALYVAYPISSIFPSYFIPSVAGVSPAILPAARLPCATRPYSASRILDATQIHRLIAFSFAADVTIQHFNESRQRS